MDIEQLKMVLDLMQKGESGSDLFIFYVLMDRLPGILAGTTILIITIYIVAFGIRTLINDSGSEQLRKAAEVDCYWSDNELRIACECLRKHYKETKKEQL